VISPPKDFKKGVWLEAAEAAHASERARLVCGRRGEEVERTRESEKGMQGRAQWSKRCADDFRYSPARLRKTSFPLAAREMA
jgi:hypothetical protein